MPKQTITHAPQQVKDCLEVYAQYGEPCGHHYTWRQKLRVFFANGSLVVRSEACIAKSNYLESRPVQEIAQYGCSDCFEVADDKKQLVVICDMVKQLDHLAIAEAKSFGKPGALGELFTALSERSYCEATQPWIQRISILKREILSLCNQPAQDDIAKLSEVFTCYSRKNNALMLICETRLNKVVVRPPGKDLLA